MVDKGKQQEELKLFNCYVQELKEIKKDLEKIKKINDISQKHSKSSVALEKYLYKQSGAISHYNAGELHRINISLANNLRESNEWIKELRKIKAETKVNRENLVGISKSEQKASHQPEKKNQEVEQECISCQQCFQEIKPEAKYYYHTTKNDNHKFCSEKCYTEYYGEICNQCVKKL